MVYISSSGTVGQKRSPWRLSIFSDTFWAVSNFFGLFLTTLISGVDSNTRKPIQKRAPVSRDQSKGGGGSSAPKNVRGMDALKKQQGSSACGAGGG
mmetsp:Transcript_43509/g.87989  ORF Transcript_43509/g.87989 Transcript_43509/m.87989 type:complete len:96 (+) Transcript_43509:69-356(+)|eukprot:CAMPEP_0171618644 /NCGR_PEP_ID=MMETSP0990-20121206/14877_1 /TAXON_ID=483369 /ORGANISM="non described non described, Strain CCMP2098" /LENGTH=95 /DNA_ID=CAMNT_0012183503 /DNA_START=165 /DNA_END=452 /DNA_ORIENTATION=+